MLNQFAQFLADIDGIGIPFLHKRGRGPNPVLATCIVRDTAHVASAGVDLRGKNSLCLQTEELR
jgi:hypothetical protein